MGGWVRAGGDRNSVFQARGGEILLNQTVIGISQARGQKELMTQEGIDAVTTDVVYLDTMTNEGIAQFLDMVSGDGEHPQRDSALTRRGRFSLRESHELPYPLRRFTTIATSQFISYR